MLAPLLPDLLLYSMLMT